MSRLTAAILARNEARFIGGCIESIRPLTEDIVVIDSGSSDDTANIGRERGARVLETTWPGFPAQRNRALDLSVGSQWVLFLDADERLTPASRAEIGSALADAGPEVAGFLIPRRNVIAGRVMRGGGWWPDYQARILRTGRCRYDERDAVHEAPLCDGPLFALSAPLVHLNYLTWREFLAKQLSYQRATKRSSGMPRQRAYLGAPAREFGRRFFSERGYIDGIAGFGACAMLAFARLYGVWLDRRGNK